MQNTLYHWYEEPEHSFVLVNKRKLKEMFPNEKFFFLNYKSKKVRVSSLKEFCKNVGLSFNQIEKLKLVKVSPSKYFPINLNNSHFSRIVSSITNEGHISHNRHLILYYNKEILLHKLLQKSIFKIFGIKIKKPVIKGNRNVLQTRVYGIVSRTLLKVGVIRGNKTLNQNPIPKFISRNTKLLIPYFQQLMLEEMSSSFQLKKRGQRYYLILRLQYRRSQEITKIFPKRLIQNMKSNIQYRFGSLLLEIQRKIKENPLKLIKNEQGQLIKLNIKNWLRPSYIYKTMKNLIEVHWILVIEQHNSIKNLYRNFVFNSPKLLKSTNKWKKMIKLIELWRPYKGKQITLQEFNVIKQKLKS